MTLTALQLANAIGYHVRTIQRWTEHGLIDAIDAPLFTGPRDRRMYEEDDVRARLATYAIWVKAKAHHAT